MAKEASVLVNPCSDLLTDACWHSRCADEEADPGVLMNEEAVGTNPIL